MIVRRKPSVSQAVPFSEGEAAAGVILSRRDFGRLTGAGAATVLLGFLLPSRQPVFAQAAPAAAALPGSLADLIAAYIEIASDNTIYLVTPEAEMGQGVVSSLPAILAEELGADWSQVVTRLSGAGEIYINPGKNMQATGRSMAVRGYFELLRKVGATARVMLTDAAAEQWKIVPSLCRVESGHIINGKTNDRLRFADVVEAAAKRPVPTEVDLKPREAFKILGTSFPQKDIEAKVNGTAIYGADVILPDMLVASVMQPPAFGGKVVSFDEDAAKAVAGVVDVFKIKDGLAAVAKSYWQARQALEAAAPEFDAGENGAVSNDEIITDLVAGLEEEGIVARNDGDVAALEKSATRIDGQYSVPYLAHTTMEPMSCTAHVHDGICELWTPSQGPTRARDDVAKHLGLEPTKVIINRTYLGGGFGRRWQTDFATQAAEISQKVGKPIKLIWSREEDVQHDYYRPAFAMRFDAGLSKKGEIEALHIKVSGASIGEFGRPPRPGVLDRLAVSGLGDAFYKIPNYKVESVKKTGFVPIGTWRSVGHSQNGFFLESIIDEIAHAAKADPLAFRRKLLGEGPRWTPLFDEIIKLSNWNKPLPQGRARGIAMGESYGSYVAEVVELSVNEDRGIEIHNIYAVIDCGFAVNPLNVERQMESAIIYGLTAVMNGKVTIADGAVEQSNFHDYPALMMENIPPITLRLLNNAARLDSKEIGGVGEPGLPPLAPALTNAIYAATGERIRDLPLADHGYSLI